MDINTKTNTKSTTTKLVVTALLTAIAFVLQYIEVSIPIVPSFLKLDFSDIPELIGAFAIGPLYGVVIAALKNIMHLPFGSSMAVGELSNFILGGSFAFTAGIVYKYKKNFTGAVLGSLLGMAVMTLISIPSNYFIVYPVYAEIFVKGDMPFNQKMDIIIGLYKVILPASDTLIKCLLIFNAPFTFAKGLICAIVTFVVYKPLSNIINKMNSAFNNKAK